MGLAAAVCTCVWLSRRHFPGDIVAVELLPESQWKGASKTLPGGAAAAAAGDQSPGSDVSPEAAAAADADVAPEIFQVGWDSSDYSYSDRGMYLAPPQAPVHTVTSDSTGL